MVRKWDDVFVFGTFSFRRKLMTFQMDIVRECLASWVHLRILETLARKPKAMSQRGLAAVIGLPRVTVLRALHDLGQTGLIKSNRVGNAVYWDFDRQGYLYENLMPVLEGLSKLTPPLLYLKTLIKKTVPLPLPSGGRCILFGSTVLGEDSPSSDIDLCLILPDKVKKHPPSLMQPLEKLQDLCREKFGKLLNILWINSSELSSPSHKKLCQNIQKGIEIR